MKKNYEAPNFDVITYSLHEAIAGNCAKTLEELQNDEDYNDFTFVNEMDTCVEKPITAYCYFASNGMLISNS